METGIVAMGWRIMRQFFNGLIIILALLGHRFMEIESGNYGKFNDLE